MLTTGLLCMNITKQDKELDDNLAWPDILFNSPLQSIQIFADINPISHGHQYEVGFISGTTIIKGKQKPKRNFTIGPIMLNAGKMYELKLGIFWHYKLTPADSRLEKEVKCGN